MTHVLPATWVPGPLSEAERIVLAEEAARTKADCALEVGHYLGASTSILLNSLPPAVPLVTIDHHRGDVSTPPALVEDYLDNISPFIRDRRVETFITDMRTAFDGMAERVAVGRDSPIPWFGFIFYDADHTENGVREFWRLVVPFLAERCTLIYDDADWPGQAILAELAINEGFIPTRDRPLVRKMPADKTHPRTFTLEILRRYA